MSMNYKTSKVSINQESENKKNHTLLLGNKSFNQEIFIIYLKISKIYSYYRAIFLIIQKSILVPNSSEENVKKQ